MSMDGKKMIIYILILFLLAIPCSEICHAQTKLASAKPVTTHTPSYRKSPEQQIPEQTISTQKGNRWMWIAGLGALTAGILLGAGGGGGGDASSSSSDKTNIKVTW
jgi:hypothetical protein